MAEAEKSPEIKRTPEEIAERIKQVSQELSCRTGLTPWRDQYILMARLEELKWLSGENADIRHLLR